MPWKGNWLFAVEWRKGRRQMERLMELLRTRRSYRRFLQREISQEIEQEILEAARLASSAMNRQPLSYVVIRKPEKVKAVFAHTKWGGALPDGQGQPKAGEEPVLFIAVVINTDINSSCETDAGLAISNMTLAAWNHGVGSCIIGACNKPVLSELLGLHREQQLHSVVGFGYPSHKSRVVDAQDSENVKYYLDADRNYVVPKRRLEDMVRYF